MIVDIDELPAHLHKSILDHVFQHLDVNFSARYLLNSILDGLDGVLCDLISLFHSFQLRDACLLECLHSILVF